MTDENLQDESPAEGAPALSDDIAAPAASPTAPAEATESLTDDASEDAKPKGAGKRIDELTRLRRDAERERDHWREMAMRGQPADMPPEPQAPVAPAKIPTLAEYEYDEAKYQTALLEYTEAVATRKVEQVFRAERDKQAAEASQKTWQQRTEEFAKSRPDYTSKVNDPSLTITAAMAREIQASDIGPELALHLADNRDLAGEIARLPEAAAIRAIGRIEGRLMASKEAAPTPPPSVSKAPPPPPRIEASNSEMPVRTTDASGDSLTDDEWVRAERQRIYKLRKRNA